MQPFVTTRRVEFCDTDLAGIVHFSNFFRYMEAAEVDFLRSRGISVLLEWEGQEIGFPRVAAACDYLKPATFMDVLTIAVTLVKIGRSSLSYEHEFRKGDEVVARGKITCVCCRHEPGQGLKAIEIPASLRARLEQQV